MDYSKVLRDRLEKSQEYHEALEIAKTNAKGKIWLVGGSVSRTLVEELYGVKQEGYDFDFLIEELNELVIPEGWSVSREKFGNPTFTKHEQEIDLFPIKTHNYIKKNNLEPTIENFLKGVPFTIQALVYDIDEEVLIGDGIEALQKKEFGVNNMEEALEVAKRKNVSINKRMEKKAKSLGFSIIRV